MAHSAAGFEAGDLGPLSPIVSDVDTPDARGSINKKDYRPWPLPQSTPELVLAVSEVTSPVEKSDPCEEEPKAKRKAKARAIALGSNPRAKDAPEMTAEEARAQASIEGLAFVTSSIAASGFHHVAIEGREGKKNRYNVYAGQKTKGAFLGSYATAEEAALVYARHTGNTSAYCPPVGPSERALSGIAEAHSLTVVCKREGCGALVDLCTAKRQACANQRATYAVGDGCGGPNCAKGRFNKKQFREKQSAIAKALLEGRRRLLSWPSGPSETGKRSRGQDVLGLVLSDGETRAIAQAVLGKAAAASGTTPSPWLDAARAGGVAVRALT